jgi:hypothetical protein
MTSIDSLNSINRVEKMIILQDVFKIRNSKCGVLNK